MTRTRQWQIKEDVVITGMSGRLPSADNLEEFEKNLYSKEDMVIVDNYRWPAGEVKLLSL